MERNEKNPGVWACMSWWHRFVLIVNWCWTISQLIIAGWHVIYVFFVRICMRMGYEWVNPNAKLLMSSLSLLLGFIALTFAILLFRGLYKRNPKLIVTYIIYGLLISGGVQLFFIWIGLYPYEDPGYYLPPIIALYLLSLWLLGRTSNFYVAYNRRVAEAQEQAEMLPHFEQIQA